MLQALEKYKERSLADWHTHRGVWLVWQWVHTGGCLHAGGWYGGGYTQTVADAAGRHMRLAKINRWYFANAMLLFSSH